MTDIKQIKIEMAEMNARREAARFDPLFLDRLRTERDHQIARWGDEHDRAHGPYDWIVFLTKYVGRAAVAAMTGNRHEFGKALVQVAALCAAAHRATYNPRLVAEWEREEVAKAGRRAART